MVREESRQLKQQEEVDTDPELECPSVVELECPGVVKLECPGVVELEYPGLDLEPDGACISFIRVSSFFRGRQL